MTDPDQKAVDKVEKRERRRAKKRRILAAASIDAFNDTGAAQHIARRHRTDNKVREYTVAQLLNQFRDPRAVLLEMANTSTAELAKKLRCTRLEAHQERRHAALAVLPYIASKMPVQVDMRHTRAIHITFEADETGDQPLEQLTHRIAPAIDLAAEDITAQSEQAQPNGSNNGRGAKVAG